MNDQAAKCPRCNGFLDDGIVGSNGYGYVPVCKCHELVYVGWICPNCNTRHSPQSQFCTCKAKKDDE